MPENDALEVLNDALECKTPKRIPTFCLGADWDFMERFLAEVGFTFEEFKQYKKERIPFMCPTHIALSIKLNIDLAWITSLGQVIWLDEFNEPAQMHGGRFKIVTRMSTYELSKRKVKHPIPHWWYFKEGLTTKEAIQNYMKLNIKYSKNEFKRYRKVQQICEEKYNLIIASGLTGPWENLHFGIGFANIAKFWRKDRKFLHEINNFYCDFALKGMEELLKYGKPPIVMIGDDYGYNSGLQMSLEMWRELVKPTLAEHVRMTHERGSKFILHSCGNIGALFKDFIEIGIDGVESLKPWSNNLLELKQKYGKNICLIGTIDDSNMLIHSTPAQVKKSVTESIKNLGPGGYIPGATNFLLDQPVDNIYAMLEAIREYNI
ncbi:MAG: uroporphyrinogen decarboxylase family protein [Promethearchaeota archaeon]